ncbi:hypothetical protein A3F86_03100 [candidate division WOR-1 bacterium RIFCSPLOWO2_12_FULL_45_9]|uniref:Uncharacterized protein n=1 Tax=candidate division WOR-1 bacterium RIFCSPLOWO2_12_FULL_45_9 TaxID=1802568 RepID=A0A1F4RI88_UNCSA|nr:MAG: hypothetical protein A3F86_03100 [candidate division WOR-1 bacterium RIFCSPLOWO2_12_FULL_45_9]
MIKKRKTTKINLRKPPKVQNEARSAIGERNRITLAYMELARDKTFQRLSEEQKLHTVREVLSIGDEVAGWVLAEYDTNDPRKIASKLGVRVFGEDRGKKKGAEYRKGKNEIVVYRDFHEKLVREIKSAELSDHILKFMVAHELFHYLEISRVGQIYKRFKFNGWRLGPYKKDRYIKGLSDVAAQAFTLSLLGLEISPQVFDYLTYILYTNL